MNWYDDLCEYYQVSPEKALELGTRKKGRKPDLPGSATCKPVSGLTFEEIWESKPRETTAQIFEFYKDIGAWSSFRQCKYHEHGPAYNTGPITASLVSQYFFSDSLYNKNQLTTDIRVLEYGAGVAAISCWLHDNLKNCNFKFHINDVPCEHLTFGNWRLKKRGADVEKFEIEPDKFPDYGNVKFDFIFMLDVLEHLNDPYQAIQEVIKFSENNKTFFFETWVDHDDQKQGTHCDLDRDKEKTKNLIQKNFSLIHSADGMRVWRKCLWD